MRFFPALIAGLVLAAGLAEATLQCLPVISGIRVEPSGGAKPFTRYLPRQDYTESSGWALANARHGRTNAEGYANSRDFGSGGTLVIGDSYIEAFMLDYGDTLQGRLDAAGAGGVAAAGSGNGLADALQLARYYLPRNQPRAVVLFVEPSDLAELGLPPIPGHNGFTLDGGAVGVLHQPYRESPLKPGVQRSALLRYLYYNLKLADWLAMQGAALRAAPVPTPASTSTSTAGGAPAAKARMLDYYFSELQALAAARGTRLLFLMDGDRKAIYAGAGNGAGKPAPPAWNARERALFQRLARAHGGEVIDMQPVFAAHWAQYRERMDFLPADGHWNRVAHQLAATEVLKRLAAPPR